MFHYIDTVKKVCPRAHCPPQMTPPASPRGNTSLHVTIRNYFHCARYTRQVSTRGSRPSREKESGHGASITRLGAPTPARTRSRGSILILETSVFLRSCAATASNRYNFKKKPNSANVKEYFTLIKMKGISNQFPETISAFGDRSPLVRANSSSWLGFSCKC